MRFSSIGFALPVLLVGCAASSSPAEQTNESELGAEKVGQDVTVLQAWLGQTVGQKYPSGYQLGDHALDFSRCNGSDCTGAADDVLPSTLVGPFQYEKQQSGQCETVEVRTIVRKSAYDAP